MKCFLYALGVMSAIGVYLLIFTLMYIFTEKEVLEIIAVDLMVFTPSLFWIFGNIEQIVRRLGNGKNRN